MNLPPTHAFLLGLLFGWGASLAAFAQSGIEYTTLTAGSIVPDPGKNTFTTLSEWEAFIGQNLVLKEAPRLAKLVEEGKLPPVEERLPEEPLVSLPLSKVKKIGAYQDIIYGQLYGVVDNYGAALINEHTWTGFYPNNFLSYEVSPDGREWTLHLRKGMKWSDGHPYTTEDVKFWYRDVLLNPDLTPMLFGNYRQASGAPLQCEIIDDYTFTFRFEDPHLIQEEGDLCNAAGWYAKHYLKQFHPNYQDPAILDRMVKEAGVLSWVELFEDKSEYPGLNFRNPERPMLTPYILTRGQPAITILMKRNPYYHAVDAAGHQLPYIDEIRFSATTDDTVLNMKALNGELDFIRIADFNLYPAAKRTEKEGRIQVTLWRGPQPRGGGQNLEFNLTTPDPILRQVFRDKRFRFGVSHAIHREMISKFLYFGLVGYGQVAFSEASPFYNERLLNTAIEYDLDKANALLDQTVLAERNRDGWRLAPGGKRFEFTILTRMQYHSHKVGEILRHNLKEVGLYANMRVVDGWGALQSVRNSGGLEAYVGPVWGTMEGSYGQTTNWGALWANQGYWCPEWARWVSSGGTLGEEPPPAILEAVEARSRGMQTADPVVRKQMMKVITTLAAENLWVIGIMDESPSVIVYNPRLQNIPTENRCWRCGDFGRFWLWYFEK